jgi:hypothetical protein
LLSHLGLDPLPAGRASGHDSASHDSASHDSASHDSGHNSAVAS